MQLSFNNKWLIEGNIIFLNKYLLVWTGGSSTTKDSGVTPEISFDTNGFLNGENQLSKTEF